MAEMDASFELVQKQLQLLRELPELLEFMPATSIVDRVQDGKIPAYPYITLGPGTSIPDDYDCMRGEIVSIQWDIWTSGNNESYSSAQCRKICNIIKRALHDVDLALTNNALVSLLWDMTRILDDPNPAITHGAVLFSAEIETPY